MANSELSEPIRRVEAAAVLIAKERRDDVLTTEHLLLGALTNVHVEQYLRFLSVDYARQLLLDMEESARNLLFSKDDLRPERLRWKVLPV